MKIKKNKFDPNIELFNSYNLFPEKEFKFHPSRKWRIDYAFPDKKLAIEVEGGIYTYGRHNRISGFIKDMEKYNSLTEHGWSLLRYLPQKIDFAQIKVVYDFLFIQGRNNPP